MGWRRATHVRARRAPPLPWLGLLCAGLLLPSPEARSEPPAPAGERPQEGPAPDEPPPPPAAPAPPATTLSPPPPAPPSPPAPAPEPDTPAHTRAAPVAPAARAGRARRPRVAASVVLGLVTALVPMAIGGALMPVAGDATQRAGVLVMQSGLLVAPFVSHAIAGEWARGALFALPGVAGEAGMIAVLTAYPDVTSQGAAQSRVPFAVCLGLSLGGAAAGLIDSLLAGERWDRSHLRLAPSLAPNQAGISLGGTL